MPDPLRRAGKDHGLVALGAGQQLPAALAGGRLHQHRDLAPQALPPAAPGDAPLQSDDFSQPLLLHLAEGTSSAKQVCPRPLPRVVAVGEGVVELDLFHELERQAKILLRLAGKPNENIGRQDQFGDLFAQPLRQLQVGRARVPAAHGLQHAVGAVLHRQVQLAAQGAPPGQQADQARAQVLGMGGEEAQPGGLRGLRQLRQHTLQQTGEIQLAVAVGVDVLAQQGDLPHARGLQPGQLLEDARPGRGRPPARARRERCSRRRSCRSRA